eukprot:snap_masked-scaffold_12-processed-gene-4.20-mRNA-1 protein AED:1.00 eAED:1.00 QI:0/0/0/0/1/1/2/0/95
MHLANAVRSLSRILSEFGSYTALSPKKFTIQGQRTLPAQKDKNNYARSIFLQMKLKKYTSTMSKKFVLETVFPLVLMFKIIILRPMLNFSFFRKS